MESGRTERTDVVTRRYERCRKVDDEALKALASFINDDGRKSNKIPTCSFSSHVYIVIFNL